MIEIINVCKRQFLMSIKKIKNSCAKARSCFYANAVVCTSGLIVCRSTYPLLEPHQKSIPYRSGWPKTPPSPWPAIRGSPWPSWAHLCRPCSSRPPTPARPGCCPFGSDSRPALPGSGLASPPRFGPCRQRRQLRQRRRQRRRPPRALRPPGEDAPPPFQWQQLRVSAHFGHHNKMGKIKVHISSKNETKVWWLIFIQKFHKHKLLHLII